ncbi:M23 family metallopeptidase [Arthrobacter sp. V1I9]|uniref:M23 family metallopeptidase n=1 Tax=Arthrobacter sp. V1I9 TaxID=3042275 RepID=UPI0027D903E6|nr:M23 family metallopeptidase [Arthrobacter sp. V1I9]
MRWPLDSFVITQGFHGINKDYKYEHWGTDLAADEGVDIKAPEGGVITAVNSGWKKGGYFGGNYVKMTGDSGYSYYMGHMSSVAATAGKRVNQGEVIGEVGSTGQATGPHVHFEMYKGGKAVDATKHIKGGDMAKISRGEAEELKYLMRILNSEVAGGDYTANHTGKNDAAEVDYMASMGLTTAGAVARRAQDKWNEGVEFRALKEKWRLAYNAQPGLLKQIEDLKKQLTTVKPAAAPSEAEQKLQTIRDAATVLVSELGIK